MTNSVRETQMDKDPRKGISDRRPESNKRQPKHNRRQASLYASIRPSIQFLLLRSLPHGGQTDQFLE